MSNQVHIWVEGVADQKFLSDAINIWFGVEWGSDFKSKNGNVQIRKTDSVAVFTSQKAWLKAKPLFDENNQKGIKNVIIADTDENFETRKKSITDTIIDVDFNTENDLFLLPYNQHLSESGDIEYLLEQIIHPDYQDIIKCFDQYTECLTSTGNNYFIPQRKAKIFAYMEAILGKNENIQEKNRDYTNTNYWQINTNHNALIHLKNFLQKYFEPPLILE